MWERFLLNGRNTCHKETRIEVQFRSRRLLQLPSSCSISRLSADLPAAPRQSTNLTLNVNKSVFLGTVAGAHVETCETCSNHSQHVFFSFVKWRNKALIEGAFRHQSLCNRKSMGTLVLILMHWHQVCCGCQILPKQFKAVTLSFRLLLLLFFTYVAFSFYSNTASGKS